MCHLHSLGCTGKRKDPKVQSQRWKPELSPVKEAQLPHQTIQILECLNSAGNSHRHAREEELFGVRQLVMPSGRERFLPWTCHSIPPSEACAPLLPQGAVPIPALPIPAVSQSHPLQTALSVYQTEDFILIHFMSVCCLATDSKALATNHCHPLDHHSLNFHPLEEKRYKDIGDLRVSFHCWSLQERCLSLGNKSAAAGGAWRQWLFQLLYGPVKP